jgi:N-acetylglucosamine-6-phosphate deacetylase
VDFILDGEHVDPGAFKMALACKGPAAVCLITDSNLCAGLAPGVYEGLCGTTVHMAYPGGPARDSTTGGLVGSGLTMDRAVANAVRLLGLSVPQAVRLATENPAQVLGLSRKGKIEKGRDADLILLDEDLAVTACYIQGKLYPDNP